MSRYLAKWSAAPPPHALKALSADTDKLTFRSLLTYPTHDLAGDYVNPEGCSFEQHALDPSVDLEHGRTPHIKGLPVAWARESLSKPGAPYAVEMVRLNFAGDGKPDDYHTVPVGTEYYDKSCRVSMQVFSLRQQGILPASSLEFALVPGHYKSIGWSDLERRQAYHFDRVSVVRWTVCERGVNPGALTLTKSDTPTTQVPDLGAKLLQDRRVNVGGKWEPLHGVILKALTASAPASKRTTVRVEQKGMPGYPPTAAAQPQAAPPAADPQLATADQQAAEQADDGAPASGGVAAKLEFCQAVSDAIEMYRTNMQSSDHPGLRAAAEGDIDAISKLLAKIQGRAQKHDAKLNGGGDTDMDMDTEDGEGDDEEAADDSDTSDDDDTEGDDSADKGKKKPPFGKALVVDECGVLVCPRTVYRKALYEGRVKRFSLADMPMPVVPTAPVAKAPAPPAPDELSPEMQKAIDDFQKWKKRAGK